MSCGFAIVFPRNSAEMLNSIDARHLKFTSYSLLPTAILDIGQNGLLPSHVDVQVAVLVGKCHLGFWLATESNRI